MPLPPRLTRIGLGLVFTLCLTSPTTAMALDLNALWDHAHPDISEARFRAALATASTDEQAILRTQIARTYGLRRDFDRARAELAALEPGLATASAEVRVRHALELGRTYASVTHAPEALTPSALEHARTAYTRAIALAQAAGLDALVIDAMHMMVCVDREPQQQIAWNERALAIAERSEQADAQRWAASLHNNIGYAKFLQGDYVGAHAAYLRSRALHAQAGRTRNVRIADWMIARNLRAQDRVAEALELQHALERAWAADGDVDPYVFDELAELYRLQGNAERAHHYETRAREARS